VTSSPRRELAVVIMAAGKGTRMKNAEKAKVMYKLSGQPMIHYVADLAYDLKASRVILVVGYKKETVEKYIRKSHPAAEFAVQKKQLGTCHAVLQTKPLLQGFNGDVLVLSGDVPLLRHSTIDALHEIHMQTGAVATILTAELDDPAGYGRIIRNGDHSVEKIVEHRDATPEELDVREINSGIYLFRSKELFDGLEHLHPHNVQQEYYLTDVFEYFWNHRWTVAALKAPHPDEIRGVNTIVQLSEAESVAVQRVHERSS